MTLCSCGGTRIPGLSICQKCLNSKNRFKYATNDRLRSKASKRGALRHISGAAKKVYSYYRFKAYEILGGPKCNRCGFDDPRALQIDHVDNDGFLFGKSRGGLKVYQEVIKKAGAGFQVLCSNCNWIKKAEFEGIRLEDYPSKCPPEPCRGRKSKVSPGTTYRYFNTDESLAVVAKRLGVSVQTLSVWWTSRFGREKYLKRGVRLQALAAASTGRNNKGRRFTKGYRNGVTR